MEGWSVFFSLKLTHSANMRSLLAFPLKASFSARKDQYRPLGATRVLEKAGPEKLLSARVAQAGTNRNERDVEKETRTNGNFPTGREIPSCE